MTRGDGRVGEDVTENARTIRSLPLRVKTTLRAFEVRGETVMNRRAFERLNAERDERRALALRQSAQCRRRLAAGARAADHGLAPARFLHVFPARRRPARLRRATGNRSKQLARMGFKVNRAAASCATTSTSARLLREVGRAQRDELPYEIDGVVVKVDSHRAAAAAGLHRQGAALGHRVQVPGAAGSHDGREHRGAGGPHRRADAGRAPEAGGGRAA